MQLSLEQAVAIAQVLSAKADTPPTAAIGKLGRPVIVRSRDAGVIFGEYTGNDGSTVHLANARQMWKWQAAEGGTLIDCATKGVNPAGCKFSPSQATVTVFNACALIDCTEQAANSIRTVVGGAWK